MEQLASHVVGGNRLSVGLLSGMSFGNALADALSHSAAADRITDFRESAGEQHDAFAAPGALNRTVHHVTGDMPASVLLNFRVGEFLIHAWDLAKSTGGDLHMDDELTEVVWHVWEPLLAGSDNPMFGRPRSDSDSSGAPLWRRLLEATGRQV